MQQGEPLVRAQGPRAVPPARQYCAAVRSLQYKSCSTIPAVAGRSAHLHVSGLQIPLQLQGRIIGQVGDGLKGLQC